MTVDYIETTREPSTTKKALLVGISYTDGTQVDGYVLDPIPTSTQNVEMFKNFIQERWGYTDITVMTDEAEVEERLRPTKANLERELKALRRGVNTGDRRVFYYAGHSDQLPCQTGSEEDDLDETLISVDGFKIRDNMLHNILVKNLPIGSTLTAIVDSCHSGTMLDLGHYRCNSVYYPWVNKGKRNSKSRCNTVVRRDGMVTRPKALDQPRSRMGSGEGDLPSPSIFGFMHSEIPLSDGDLNTYTEQRCMSPERQFCDGWCRDRKQRKESQHAEVISISSSNDHQISWDVTRNGDVVSMTSSLIEILNGSVSPPWIDIPVERTSSEQRPQITYAQLMTRLNHKVHSYTMDMHRYYREKRRVHRAEGTKPEDEYEMDNFQDLQLGSLSPLDMGRIFEL
ncbi:caspase domain-containing protein [Thelephora terrestris]|uniref:Caspase domain-containing protein n=1 Tax=Thelephora terrestris TaxID=56493 RepID=A0A9P6HJZ3_9AGAM|nr:caspase domain-containing protein [Thelephora terrestris]